MRKWLRGVLPVALMMSVSIFVNDSILVIVEAPLTQEKVQTKIMEVMIRNKEVAMVQV
jgi:hypothetical protein